MKLSEEQVAKVKKLLSAEEDMQEALDEIVHDVFSGKASDINNEVEDIQI